MAALPDEVFRAIVERTGAPFVIIDLGGDIVFTSDSVRGALGWSPEELVGRNMTEFVRPDDIELALTAVGEIDSLARAEAGVPLTLPVLVPGGDLHVEIAALPLYDLGIEGLIALRLRVAEAEHHLAEFVRSLVSGRALDDVLVELSTSIAAETEACGVAVHWGFDGSAFAGAAGSWHGAAAIPLDSPALTTAMAGDGEVVQIDTPRVDDPAPGAVTVWLVPVHPRRGPRPALLSIWRAMPDPPFLGHRRVFLRAADFVELALVRAAEHERLLYLAGHDSLTGAANRASFRESLVAALARGETNIAIGFCDLDRFKAVNDRFGHAVGDEVLVEVTKRIRDQLRGGDELARIGGDEFTILWRNVSTPEIARAVAQRVVDAVDDELAVADTKLQVGVSIGVVIGDAASDADSLLARADAALYESKRSGASVTLLA